ncbi:MAG TPA: hypothetical protein VGH33_06435 [Isosphaeraceae bacterium]|jgi:hypothetical protein
MIELTCWGCGWKGEVPDHFAGLRVTCKRCRAVNMASDPVTQEVFVGDWIAEIGRSHIPETVEIEVPAPVKEAV